jgi:hypothetical protein
MTDYDLTLYERVVQVTHIYLGPAADRFIDLTKLIDWIRLAVSLLTEDGEIINEYTAQLERLASSAKVKR